MSKASEWAKTSQAWVIATTFRPIHPEQIGTLMVERNGGCYLELLHAGTSGSVRVGASLDPDTAISVAHWIIDTFGESA